MRKPWLLAAIIGMIAPVAPARAGDATKLENQTQHYSLVLHIGPTETMYTAVEAKAKHPTSGEIMLSGKMAGGMSAMTGMMPISDARHVELHVYARGTGKPVSDARVTITLIGSDKKSRAVPIARMYGVAEGLDDVHYGNDVALPAGTYAVEITVNGEHVSFSLTVPQGS